MSRTTRHHSTTSRMARYICTAALGKTLVATLRRKTSTQVLKIKGFCTSSFIPCLLFDPTCFGPGMENQGNNIPRPSNSSTLQLFLLMLCCFILVYRVWMVDVECPVLQTSRFCCFHCCVESPIIIPALGGSGVWSLRQLSVDCPYWSPTTLCFLAKPQ